MTGEYYDVWENAGAAHRFGIRTIPTTIITPKPVITLTSLIFSTMTSMPACAT